MNGLPYVFALTLRIGNTPLHARSVSPKLTHPAVCVQWCRTLQVGNHSAANNSTTALANWLGWIGIESYNLQSELYGQLLGTDFMYEVILLISVTVQLILYVALATGAEKRKHKASCDAYCDLFDIDGHLIMQRTIFIIAVLRECI